MSSRTQNSCGRVAIMWLAAIVVLCVIGTIAAAQDQPAPKWEIFGGYSFFDPATNVHGLLPGGVLPASSRVESNPRGVGGSVTYNFNRWFGLTADGSGHWGSGENGISSRIDDASFYSASMGPKLTFRTHYFSPFVEALVGWHSLDSDLFQSDNRFGFMAGGGLDLNLTRHFALRLIRGDFVFSNHQYGPSSIVPATDVRGVRLQSGVVFMFGGKPTAAPVSASCTVNPTEVMVGEPATATATGLNFNSKHTLNYTWSSTGGKVTGRDNTASIDTNGVAGGNYTVTAHISDPKMKKGGEASCMANFIVKEPPKNPPTMTCSASPSTLQAGGSATITCNCTSPDNVPVTVGDWSATGGTINGSGSTATLNTAGASAGTITVSATCTDSRGLKSPPTTTQVTVENPPPPPPPAASKLADCNFENMAKIGKPWRVDNECKGKLDDVAKNLQQNADNKLVIVGNAEPTEKRPHLAAERALNSKAYLTGGEAKLCIDPSRIETRTGSAGTKTAEYWIVPASGTFSGEGTQPVDESVVKPVPDHPRTAAKKKAQR
jgi:Outer membrane protein beta-barrel domain